MALCSRHSTPVLVKRLKEMNFDTRKFTNGTLLATKRMLKDCRDDNADPVPLLYQTGYLTIADVDDEKGAYILSFPNEEVKYGFLESLLPMYVGNVGASSGKDILTLSKYVESGELDSIRSVFEALFAGIPYPTNETPFEHDFQSVLTITFTLLGQYVQCETQPNTGRIDCLIETKRFLYLFEFKRDDSAEAALRQIEEMHDALTYAADKRILYKIGVSFDSKTRRLADWKVKKD